MNGMIDFHTHILPEVDDGSDSLETSIAMLRAEAAQGIQRVVATPHFYAQHDTPEKFLVRRAEAECRLREEMAKYPGLPELSIGAEVYFFPGISNSDILQELTIDKKRCIIVEMPMSAWTDRMFRELEGIYTKQGLTPIVAHVDRYIAPFHTHRIPQRLQELPVLVQANADFFLHRSTKRMALRMLREEQIHLLGSDCHDLTGRKPNLGDAVEVISRSLGADILEHIQLHQKEVLHID